MRKMTFLLEEDAERVGLDIYPGREIRHVHTELEYLPDVLMRFKEFLQGVGYVIDGDLDVVDQYGNNNEEDEDATQDPNMDGC